MLWGVGGSQWEIKHVSDKATIVLVHGAWADGSCWSAVIESLQARGYTVTAPQFPETSLKDDVARLRQVLRRQAGPTVLVGHSYGGQIMTALGVDSVGVAALVYVAAFGLTRVNPRQLARADRRPRTRPPHRRRAGSPGYLKRTLSAISWLAWTPSGQVLSAVQQGLSMSTFEDVMGVPAWKSHPAWYLVAANDEAIPPDAERMFAKRMGATTVEVASGHLAMVSHPRVVVEQIEAAAAATVS